MEIVHLRDGSSKVVEPNEVLGVFQHARTEEFNGFIWEVRYYCSLSKSRRNWFRIFYFNLGKKVWAERWKFYFSEMTAGNSVSTKYCQTLFLCWYWCLCRNNSVLFCCVLKCASIVCALKCAVYPWIQPFL